jgi:hypothetical protein
MPKLTYHSTYCEFCGAVFKGHKRYRNLRLHLVAKPKGHSILSKEKASGCRFLEEKTTQLNDAQAKFYSDKNKIRDQQEKQDNPEYKIHTIKANNLRNFSNSNITAHIRSIMEEENKER